MANPSKRKGSTYEIVARDFIKAWAHLANVRWFVHRNPAAGATDVGDLELNTLTRTFVVEAKAEQRIDLPGYLKELDTEMANWSKREGKPCDGFVLVKRRNMPVERSYVVMELANFLQLVTDLEAQRG